MDKKDKNTEFEKIYAENFSYVYNYIYMNVLQKETTEDLCSKVFLKAYQNWDTYDSGIAGARTWLCVIARNIMIDNARSSFNKRVQVTDTPPEVAVTDKYEGIDDRVESEVERLLSKLSEEDRSFLSMRYAGGFRVKEIAEILNITENAASHRLARILEKCRKFEEDEGNKLSDFL
ncbi:MAG: RNA polymerase sigma factor [Lachnospiraceae bacterium]|nr:RNA polymerase sigma factor [Lachnospiraceae bacterium]